MDLIAIAHPKFRPWLIEKAKALGLIYKDQTFIPGEKGAYPEDLETHKTTQKGLRVFLRPVKINDEPLLKEEALRSVARYFPPQQSAQNRFYARRALQRLGELYLSTGRLEEAFQTYQALADVEDFEEEFRAVGLVGQAVVHSRRGEDNLKARKLALALPLIQRLPGNARAALFEHFDPDLREQVEALLREMNEDDTAGS